MPTPLIVTLIFVSVSASGLLAVFDRKKESTAAAALAFTALCYGAFFRPEIITEMTARKTAELERRVAPVIDRMMPTTTSSTTIPK